MQGDGRHALRPPSASADAVQRAASLVRATAVRPASRGELAVVLTCLGMTPDPWTLERLQRALETA